MAIKVGINGFGRIGRQVGRIAAALGMRVLAYSRSECEEGRQIGSYVDLYRVKLGAAKRKNYSAVHKDFGYKGSDYRLKRSAETASHYTLGQLETCLQVLLDLDKSLKSQPVDVQTLLEAALCRLALAGSGR